MRIYISVIVLFILFLQGVSQSLAQAPLFLSDSLLHLTVVANWSQVRKDIGTERYYHNAELIYTDKNGKQREVRVKLKTRGHFRRKFYNCNFPPLRFKFEDKDVINTIFEGQKKIKLVGHCQNRRKRYERYVLKEYLCYRFYEIITDKSLKTRLARIEYVDSVSKKILYKKYAFFIEHKKKMALRFGFKPYEVVRYNPEKIDQQMLSDLSLFQFFISNTDWSVKEMHNVFLITGKEVNDLPVPVPYDFDWAGFVSADYAKPNPVLPIENVKERLYRGYCVSNKKLGISIEKFNKCKDEIIALNNSFTYLPEKERKRNEKYIEDFYRIINNEKQVRTKMIELCRD